MSYETGTATDITDLIDTKLKAFAVAEGWNVNDDNWATGHLHLSKGGCFISLRNYATTFNDAFSVSRTDHRLWGHLGSAYDGTGGTPDARYIGQPDSLVTHTGTSAFFQDTNDLFGPFTSYHLFSGAVGDKDYIYLVAEADAGFFSHFYFGMADDLGFAFDPPVAFLTATYWQWWPSSTSEASDASDKYSSNFHMTPFDHNQSTEQVYSEALEPTRKMSRLEVARMYLRGVIGYNNDYPLDHVYGLGPNPLNGVTPMQPFPIYCYLAADTTKWAFYGELPNIRMASLKGRSPKEEITLGGDTWMIFPWRKQSELTDIVRPPSPAIDNTSWHAGVAIKKIV